MKRNLFASLERGEIIPGIPIENIEKQGPPQEPRPATTARVRTISCMNEQLLAELQTGEASSFGRRVSPRQDAILEGRPPLPTCQRAPASEAVLSGEDSSEDDNVESSPEFSRQGDLLRGELLLMSDRSDEQAAVASPTSSVITKVPPTPPSHTRRNTGGTIYLKSTMENPDIQATIKCVCGVYRAHIVESVARTSRRSPTSVQSAIINQGIFRDDYEDEDTLHFDKDRVPSLEEIELFYNDFFSRSQMEHDTIIMSLIYIERLIKATNGALAPQPSNWRSVLFSCMVLSSKVWDDLSMFNLDFSNVSMASGLSAFSLKRTNALELAVLTNLGFNVRVPASEYAKYYFLIRTMLTRSGLLESPLANNSDGKALESRTTHYQMCKLNNEKNERRTRSVDFSSWGREAEPVLLDTVCLEQLVKMN
jgi:hypothetical protein